MILEHYFQLGDVDLVCEQAMNGLQALEKVKNNVKLNKQDSCNFDLILMDCNMPILDGYEATQ